MAELIARETYLRRLAANKDTDVVKIITGMRRSGKSSLLLLFYDYLLAEGVAPENIIIMNFESLRFGNIEDYLSLYEFVSAKIPEKGRTYLLFDEIQQVLHWEKAVESFRLDFDVDIYITGSNARMLSSEFATLLSGRYVEIEVLPLSFKEFLSFYSFEKSVSDEEKFMKYLRFGGMPVLREYNFDETGCNQVLEGIYSTVLLRDIMSRYDKVDGVTLKKIILFLCSNIGSATSPNNIAGVLVHEKDLDSPRNFAGKTVEKYISMLNSAYLFYSVGRYDIKGRQLLKTLSKNYIADIGLRNLLLGYRDAERGHILENIVYLELRRRGYRVYIGKSGENEIDFVAEKTDEKIYFQVAESIISPETRAREIRPLQTVRDNYEKIILSMDRSFITSENGIKFVNIIDWLSE